MVKNINWFDRKGNELIVRKFKGEVQKETETTITIIYRKRLLVLEKEHCIIF